MAFSETTHNRTRAYIILLLFTWPVQRNSEFTGRRIGRYVNNHAVDLSSLSKSSVVAAVKDTNYHATGIYVGI